MPNNPYKNYAALLKYHTKSPDEGMTPEQSANYHIGIELLRALNATAKKRGLGVDNSNFTVEIPEKGYKEPLAENLGNYAAGLLYGYDAPIEGNARRVFFGKNARPLMVESTDKHQFLTNTNLKLPRGLNPNKPNKELYDYALKQARFILGVDRAPTKLK
jgi:hypothetical protein